MNPNRSAASSAPELRSLPTLAVVIITRNEAEQIGGCIESVLAGTSAFPGTKIVIVDSDSRDATTGVAAGYPVTVYRYSAPRMSAAAGRWIGAQHVQASYTLFIDGDCRLAPGWVELAVAAMERSSTTAVICGGRQNAYAEPEGLRVEDAGWDLGGTALYRTAVLMRVGGFNPFISGNEEQELLARILALGYRKVTTQELMAVHHTGVKESVNGLWRRHRNGMLTGPGQVLRASLAAGTFWYHAAAFNRYILTLLFVLVGFVCTVVERWHPAFLAAWISTAVTAMVVLCVRQKSVSAAAFIVADWVLVAFNAIPAFLRPPRAVDDFVYELELVSGPAEAPRETIASPWPAPAAAPTPALAVSFEPPDACLTPAVSEQWRALLAASDNVYAQYQSPEWVAHLHATRRDKLLHPLVVRDADGRVAGVVSALLAPYDLNYEMRGTSISRSRLRAAAILGGVPLLPPDADLHERALGAIFREAKRAQCLYLHSVPTSSFLWCYLQESPWIRERFRMYLPDGVRRLHLVRLPETFDAYLAKFKHKKRYNLARQERMLREHVDGRLELRRIERVDQVASFRAAVATVMADSWQGRVAMPEAYTILQDCKPFEDLAQRGLIRSYVLECAGAPSAFVLGYQFGDIYHYAEIAYRQQDARFSPGTTLLYLLIQDLIAHRSPKLLNFGIGDAVYKREFGNVQFQDASVLLLDRTVRNAAVQVVHSTFQGLVRNVGQRFREIRAA